MGKLLQAAFRIHPKFVKMKDMGKKLILTIMLMLAFMAGAGAQDYVATPVTISKEKVKLDGKVYYSHIVLERQTLFGISKAYDVPIEDIYKANESINLRETGLKKNSIILIPAPQPQTGRKGRRKDESANVPTVEIAEQNQPEQVEDTVEMPAVDTDAHVVSSDEDGVSEELAQDDEPESAPILSFEPKSDVDVMLFLPLKASSGRGQSGYMDFYSGALMAARAKGNQGINVNISIYDVANGVPAIKSEELDNADVIIGPVFYDNMKTLLSRVPSHTHVVSPMDARTESLIPANGNMIQAPASNDRQFQDLVAWMEREYSEGEKIIIVYEKGRDSEIAKVSKLLSDGGHEFQTLSYNLLEGRNIDSALKSRMNPGKVNRVFIVSESEAFVNDAIRNLSLLCHESAGYNVALYGTSKIKTFETIEAENLHLTNLHLALPYNVNYDDARVKDFLMKYRAIFNTEPTAFAFQGYDLTYFFITEIAKYGDNWYDWFTQDSASLLQADFKFSKADDSENSGYVNSALRHVVYGPEFTVTSVNL